MRLRKLPPIEISAGQWHRIFSYPLTAPPVDLATLPEANRQRALVMRRMREIAERS
jgi:hypothetical protein